MQEAIMKVSISGEKEHIGRLAEKLVPLREGRQSIQMYVGDDGVTSRLYLRLADRLVDRIIDALATDETVAVAEKPTAPRQLRFEDADPSAYAMPLKAPPGRRGLTISLK